MARKSEQAEIADLGPPSDGKRREYLAMFTTALPKEEIAISEGNRNILARLEPIHSRTQNPLAKCLNHKILGLTL